MLYFITALRAVPFPFRLLAFSLCGEKCNVALFSAVPRNLPNESLCLRSLGTLLFVSLVLIIQRVLTVAEHRPCYHLTHSAGHNKETAISLCGLAGRCSMLPVSYTHLTLPTT